MGSENADIEASLLRVCAGLALQQFPQRPDNLPGTAFNAIVDRMVTRAALGRPEMCGRSANPSGNSAKGRASRGAWMHRHFRWPQAIENEGWQESHFLPTVL
jgi:hypothetical protein